MNKEIKCIFPNEALLKFQKNDVGTSLFCNSFFNGKKYGGLLLICDNILMKQLNIKAYHILNSVPEFAFRMFSVEQFFFTDYLVEFQAVFYGAKKQTKLHMHQDTKSFRDFCKYTIKHKIFVLMVYNVDTELLNPTYINLQGEENLDWLERNFEISKSQLSGKLLDSYKKWGQLSTKVQEQNKEPSIYFLQNATIPFLDVFRNKK